MKLFPINLIIFSLLLFSQSAESAGLYEKLFGSGQKGKSVQEPQPIYEMTKVNLKNPPPKSIASKTTGLSKEDMRSIVDESTKRYLADLEKRKKESQTIINDPKMKELVEKALIEEDQPTGSFAMNFAKKITAARKTPLISSIFSPIFAKLMLSENRGLTGTSASERAVFPLETRPLSSYTSSFLFPNGISVSFASSLNNQPVFVNMNFGRTVFEALLACCNLNDTELERFLELVIGRLKEKSLMLSITVPAGEGEGKTTTVFGGNVNLISGNESTDHNASESDYPEHQLIIIPNGRFNISPIRKLNLSDIPSSSNTFVNYFKRMINDNQVRIERPLLTFSDSRNDNTARIASATDNSELINNLLRLFDAYAPDTNTVGTTTRIGTVSPQSRFSRIINGSVAQRPVQQYSHVQHQQQLHTSDSDRSVEDNEGGSDNDQQGSDSDISSEDNETVVEDNNEIQRTQSPVQRDEDEDYTMFQSLFGNHDDYNVEERDLSTPIHAASSTEGNTTDQTISGQQSDEDIQSHDDETSDSSDIDENNGNIGNNGNGGNGDDGDGDNSSDSEPSSDSESSSTSSDDEGEPENVALNQDQTLEDTTIAATSEQSAQADTKVTDPNTLLSSEVSTPQRKFPSYHRLKNARQLSPDQLGFVRPPPGLHSVAQQVIQSRNHTNKKMPATSELTAQPSQPIQLKDEEQFPSLLSKNASETATLQNPPKRPQSKVDPILQKLFKEVGKKNEAITKMQSSKPSAVKSIPETIVSAVNDKKKSSEFYADNPEAESILDNAIAESSVLSKPAFLQRFSHLSMTAAEKDDYWTMYHDIKEAERLEKGIQIATSTTKNFASVLPNQKKPVAPVQQKKVSQKIERVQPVSNQFVPASNHLDEQQHIVDFAINASNETQTDQQLDQENSTDTEEIEATVETEIIQPNTTLSQSGRSDKTSVEPIDNVKQTGNSWFNVGKIAKYGTALLSLLSAIQPANYGVQQSSPVLNKPSFDLQGTNATSPWKANASASVSLMSPSNSSTMCPVTEPSKLWPAPSGNQFGNLDLTSLQTGQSDLPKFEAAGYIQPTTTDFISEPTYQLLKWPSSNESSAIDFTSSSLVFPNMAVKEYDMQPTLTDYFEYPSSYQSHQLASISDFGSQSYASQYLGAPQYYDVTQFPGQEFSNVVVTNPSDASPVVGLYTIGSDQPISISKTTETRLSNLFNLIQNTQGQQIQSEILGNIGKLFEKYKLAMFINNGEQGTYSFSPVEPNMIGFSGTETVNMSNFEDELNGVCANILQKIIIAHEVPVGNLLAPPATAASGAVSQVPIESVELPKIVLPDGRPISTLLGDTGDFYAHFFKNLNSIAQIGNEEVLGVASGLIETVFGKYGLRVIDLPKLQDEQLMIGSGSEDICNSTQLSADLVALNSQLEELINTAGTLRIGAPAVEAKFKPVSDTATSGAVAQVPIDNNELPKIVLSDGRPISTLLGDNGDFYSHFYKNLNSIAKSGSERVVEAASGLIGNVFGRFGLRVVDPKNQDEQLMVGSGAKVNFTSADLNAGLVELNSQLEKTIEEENRTVTQISPPKSGNVLSVPNVQGTNSTLVSKSPINVPVQKNTTNMNPAANVQSTLVSKGPISVTSQKNTTSTNPTAIPVTVDYSEQEDPLEPETSEPEPFNFGFGDLGLSLGGIGSLLFGIGAAAYNSVNDFAGLSKSSSSTDSSTTSSSANASTKPPSQPVKQGGSSSSTSSNSSTSSINPPKPINRKPNTSAAQNSQQAATIADTNKPGEHEPQNEKESEGHFWTAWRILLISVVVVAASGLLVVAFFHFSKPVNPQEIPI